MVLYQRTESISFLFTRHGQTPGKSLPPPTTSEKPVLPTAAFPDTASCGLSLGFCSGGAHGWPEILERRSERCNFTQRTGCESPQKKKPSWPLENEVQITSTNNKSQMKEELLDSGRLEGKEGVMRLLLAWIRYPFPEGWSLGHPINSEYWQYICSWC